MKEASHRHLLCTSLLVLVATTAGCPNPWESTSYHAYGKVVEGPPENATAILHDHEDIRDEEVIQQVVGEAIVTYENQTGTDAPRRLYHTRRTVSKGQFRDTGEVIEDSGGPPTSDVIGGEHEEAVLYVRCAGHVVRVWVGNEVAV